MNIDERTNIIWQQVSKIADTDKEFARSLINIDSAPYHIRIKLSNEEPKKIEQEKL